MRSIPAHLFSAALFSVCGFFVTTGSLIAQEANFSSGGSRASLIELYTSEGCSSCPSAEALLSQLTRDPRLWKEIFPIAFHVDYWDGLGWPDRFARPKYTDRQRDYAARLHQDSVYTPEFVVDGAEFRGFFHGESFPAPAGNKSGELALSLANGNVSATYTPAAGESTRSLRINTALLGLHITSDVQRGENGGRTLRHDFIVLGFASAPLAAGKTRVLQSDPVALTSSTGDAAGAFIGWVSADDGSILQIAGGPLHAN